MNIFYEYAGIIGKAETAHLSRTMKEFLELSDTIRGKLGKQAYLLDKYISMLWEGINATLVHDAAEDGFQITRELVGMCLSAMDGTGMYQDHPFYKRVKKYIDTHPLPHQEKLAKRSLYFIALAGDFMEYTVKGYHEKLEDAQDNAFDAIYMRELFHKISAMIGDKTLMEHLNLLIRQRFLIVTPMEVFLQSFTNELLYAMMNRDIETGKFVFQLHSQMISALSASG